MNIVKVDATNSTSTFLKEMCQQNEVENYTIVVADNQTNGRGQMHSVWQSDGFKNLTFSILIRFEDLNIDNQFYLSKVISLSIQDVLIKLLPCKIVVKWPNDILADSSKIAGVLIENLIKKGKVSQSIIGVGLNVNQKYFKGLPHVTSMKLVSNQEFDLKVVLNKLINSIQKFVELLNTKQIEIIDELYLASLYKINNPTMFKDAGGFFFMGKIIGVSLLGKLQVELENETVKEFDLKEIEFVTLKENKT